jgi:hypothetical protein
MGLIKGNPKKKKKKKKKTKEKNEEEHRLLRLAINSFSRPCLPAISVYASMIPVAVGRRCPSEKPLPNTQREQAIFSLLCLVLGGLST